MTTIDLGIVAVYLAGMLAVGWAVARRITGFRDFFVAGGQMTTPLLVCTLVSTYYGLDVLFGGSEVAYQEGVVAWFFYARPYYIAIVVAALFIARRLKRFDVLSLPDVAARYYGRGTQAVVALASFLYSIPLMAVMVSACCSTLCSASRSSGACCSAPVWRWSTRCWADSWPAR